MKGPLVSCFCFARCALSIGWLACGCRATPAKESGGALRGPTACPSAEAPNAIGAWSERFAVERGGVVTLLAASDDGKKTELLRWQSASGLASVDTSPCEKALAVWIPGVECPVPATIEQGLAAVAPILFSRCFSPMTADAIVEGCERRALAARTCAATLPPIASACRASESARCKRLRELAARYAEDGR